MYNSIFIAAICVLGYSSVFGRHLTVEGVKYAEEVKDKNKMECMIESGLNQTEYENVVAGNAGDSTKELNSFAECYLKKKGDMRSDGSIVVHSRDNFYIRKCKELVGVDSGDTAGKIFKCAIDKFHEFNKVDPIGAAISKSN